MQDAPTTASSGKDEWRRGWPLAGAACAGMTLAPLSIYTLGVFMGPLEREFGWGRSQLSASITVISVVTVLLAPVVGLLIDRLGPRRIAIVGALLFCTAFACLALTTASLTQWYLTWLFVGLGAVLLTPTVWTAAVSSRFEKARGLAIAVALCGSPITAMAAPQVAEQVIAGLGWRAGYVTIALVWAAIVVPLLVFFFFGATDLWRRDHPSSTVRTAPRLPGADLSQVFRSLTFLKLAFAATLITVVMSAMVVHFVPLLMMRGVERGSALLLVSILGVAGAVGRLGAGFLLDRLDPRLFGTFAFVLPALAFAALLMPEPAFTLVIFITLVVGLATGAEIEVSSYLAARYFGLRNYGAVFGTIAGLIVLGSGVGPLLAGWVYDQFSSYDRALQAGLILSPLTALLILTLPRTARLPSVVGEGRVG